MSQVYGALLLLVVYFGVVLLTLAVSTDVTSLPDIARICNVASLSGNACQAGAISVAAQELTAIVLVVVVMIGLERKAVQSNSIATRRIEGFEQSRSLVFLLLVAVTAVLTIHNIRHDPTGGRIPPSESGLISLENLTWPLLLQLVFWTRQICWKVVLIAFLAALVALSPFRSPLFSIFYFGALIPFAVMLAVGNFMPRRTKVISVAAMMVLILFTSLVLLYQTNSRYSDQDVTGRQESRFALLEAGLTSRGVSPFFQAALVKRLALKEALPGFLASIGQKFGAGTNLNEYVFKAIYSNGWYGQTTTLYYGESIANTGISPIFWAFAGPLALVLTYFLLRPFCDVGLLIAIALWRSSEGGLFDVITALTLQLGFCLVLSYSRSRPNGVLARTARDHEMA